MANTAKSVSSMKTTIENAWRALEDTVRKASSGPGAPNQGMRAREYLEKALAESTRVEKEHRRFTDGRAGYRLPVELTAKYFVVKHVLQADGRPTSWGDVASMRYDVVLSNAVAEALMVCAPEKFAEIPRSILDIDYAEDIAK